jgi:hypothetical protein
MPRGGDGGSDLRSRGSGAGEMEGRKMAGKGISTRARRVLADLRPAPGFTPRAVALATVLVASMVGGQAGAVEQGTPEERRACTPDVMKHCSAYIPDANRIELCLRRNLRALSPACRIVLAGDQKK